MALDAEAVFAPDGDVLLVAEDDSGAPAGWLAGTFDGAYPGPDAPVRPPHGYVQAVVADPAARRAGVGRALLEAFTATAREHGLEWVFAVPGEAPGVAGRVAWLAESGFTPVVDPGELWPVMGRWTEPGR
ncbi:GNAT family N-acetyltransferase [Nocardiopsis sp. TSRI0078]|uniref:GNAT family N-acetyltransferase n=1 Tax=Nocardiopsis sp. TSRI0078 TaxID=1718951 RepID=UPI00237877EA|nr:GNAT family N-acetyltransferase [Nocardiopsis sp. TSRI0078]